LNLQEAIENRRSVRNYTPQKVDKAIVEKLIEAAIQAPSAGNSQPWSFAVIQDKKLLQEYSDRAKKLLLGRDDRRLAACQVPQHAGESGLQHLLQRRHAAADLR
jgi:nitroreductase